MAEFQRDIQFIQASFPLIFILILTLLMIVYG